MPTEINLQRAQVKALIESKEKDLGGFSVLRTIPTAKQRNIGPWVFFDHMPPRDLGPGEGINVRPHPHINLATVTFLFEGEVLHRDSLGSHQLILPGEINLMIAGSGITHSERMRPEVRDAHKRMHAIQLWHALPEEEEEMDAEFHHYGLEMLPHTEVGGVDVHVLMGEAYGVRSPVKTFKETLYLTAQLKAGARLTLPAPQELGLYVAEGAIRIGGALEIEEGVMAVAEDGAALEIEARQDATIAVIGGEPLGKRHMFWNFVSSRKERVEEAAEAWRRGEFPKVDGDEIEFIPLP